MKYKHTLAGLLVLAGVFILPSCGNVDTQSTEATKFELTNSFAIENVRIFDGEQFIENSNLVVTAGVVTEIGGVDLPQGIVIIDGAGSTLLPGFVDAHVHAFDESSLQDALRFGVTTQFDMFTDVGFAKAQTEVRDSYGQTDKADLFTAGTLVTSEGGHGTQFSLPIETIASPDEAVDFVARRLAEGSDYIKIVYEPENGFFTSISQATLDALVVAAQEQGVLAVVHVSSLQGARDAIDAGADGLVHIFGDQLADEEFIAMVRRSGAFVVPTLSVVASAGGKGNGAGLVKDVAHEPFLTAAQKANLLTDFGAGSGLEDRFNLKRAMENVRMLHAAGVPIYAGTDAPNPGTSYGVSLHGELSFLVTAGLTPLEALVAATSGPANAFRATGRGVIAPGARADMVLVKGHPGENISATREIVKIFKNGYLVDRSVIAVDMDDAFVQKPVLEQGLVSDFEDGLASSFGMEWVVTTDQLARGTSSGIVSLVDQGGDGSAGALRVDGEITTKFLFPWSGAGLFFSVNFDEAFDLSSYEKISFMAKGETRDLSLLFFTRTSMQRPAMATFKVDEVWTRYEFKLADIRGAAMDEVFGFAVTAGRPKGVFSFELDEVRFE